MLYFLSLWSSQSTSPIHVLPPPGVINTHACINTCVRGPEVNLGCLSSGTIYLPSFFEVESFPELRDNSLFYLVSWPVNLGDSPVSAPALALPLQTHATISDFSYWCWKRNSDAQISHLPRSTVLFWVQVFTFPFPSCPTGVMSTFYHVEKYIRCCRKLSKLPALVLLFVCLLRIRLF